LEGSELIMKTGLKSLVVAMVFLLGITLVCPDNFGFAQGDDQIEQLIIQMTDSNFGISSKASNALVDLGNLAVPSLEALLLESTDQVVRLKTIVALERIGTLETIVPLSLGLLDSNTVNRERSEAAILKLTDRGIEAYQKLLLTGNKSLVDRALKALSTAGWSDQDLANYLIKEFPLSSFYTKNNILKVLSQLHTEAALNFLVQIMRDESQPLILRLTSLEALADLNPQAITLDDWIIVLSTETIENFRRLYWNGFDAIVEAGVKSVPVLTKALDSADPELRARAAILLGELGADAKGASQDLEKLLIDPHWYVQVEAAFALGKINPESDYQFGIPEVENSSSVNDDVQLEEFSTNVRISNGLISMVIGKSNAKVNELLVNGQNILAPKGAYFDANVPGYININADKFEIVSNTSDMVHVKGTKFSTSSAPFEIESHYILRRGDSGYYSFLVYRHNSNFSAELVQTRHVIRVDTERMPNMIVSNNRQGQLPTQQMLGAAENVADATVRLADGSVFTKYNWAMYEGEHFVHGMAGNDLGLWVIKGSNEYQPSGPVKQNLTVHEENVVLAMLHSTHYGSPAVKLPANSGWKKIYGPFFVYVNTGDNLTELWTDAKVRAEYERQAWPYNWLNLAEYDNQRTSVSGELNLADGSIPVDAWVILGESSTYWTQQAKDYLYWSKVNYDGTFTIDNVRPGTYTLWAWGGGVFGEFEYPEIDVVTDQPTVLPKLTWEPLNSGTLVWEIGIPNRTADEFFSIDHHRNWGLWFEYHRQFPEGVNYYIGSSDYTKDWNFVQPAMMVGEWGNRTAEPWRIYFDLPEQPSNDLGILTIAIAGTGGVRLDVLINGQLVKSLSYSADGSVHRSGISGIYHLEQIEFDATLLNQGENIVELKVHGSNSLSSGIMYDYLRLELI